MKKIDWAVVTKENVLEAIRIFLLESPNYPAPRSTYLLHKERHLPAKHIRGMAYKVATGREISKEEYAGGMETIRFFERRGFDVVHTGSEEKAMSSKNKQEPTTPSTPTAPQKEETEALVAVKTPEIPKSQSPSVRISSKRVLEQKHALQKILNRMFDGDVVCEKSFPWMKTPDQIGEDYQKIVAALSSYRGDKTFIKKNASLRCDFVCESHKVIVEYDERQHFSEARRLSLLSYPDVSLLYDKDLWIKVCEDVQARDGNPHNRDELRAFYDSARDIEAARNGYSLIRIMHEQFDLEGPDAYQKVQDLLKVQTFNRESLNDGLKIGLYLQTESFHNPKSFSEAMKKAKKADFDLLVFPEACYTPFMEKVENDDILDHKIRNQFDLDCLDLSEEFGKAVIISGMDKFGTIFSVFANAAARKEETSVSFYFKHTMTYFSPLEFDDYQENIPNIFEVIELKGHRIGMTICYDSNHAIFSRMYGLQGVDILVNCTGGNVIYDKWLKYNSARSIENSCFTFVTMGGEDDLDKINSYVYGISPNGKLLNHRLIDSEADARNIPGKIYIYDTVTDDQRPEPDKSLDQQTTLNKMSDFSLPVGDISSVLAKARAISNNLYVLKRKESNIVFACVDGEDIMRPECVMPLLYDDRLKKYENKKYIIVNRHEYLDEDFYRNKLSLILKVRAMENYCVVILESDLVNHCYQTGKNKTAQVVAPLNNNYNIDLTRAGGPEVIWRDKEGQMKASWRKNLEVLIREMQRFEWE